MVNDIFPLVSVFSDQTCKYWLRTSPCLSFILSVHISHSPPKQNQPNRLVKLLGKKIYQKKMKSKLFTGAFNRTWKRLNHLPGSGERKKVAARRRTCNILGDSRSTVCLSCPNRRALLGLWLPPVKWDRMELPGAFLSLLQEVFTEGVVQSWSCGHVTMAQQAEVLGASWL